MRIQLVLSLLFIILKSYAYFPPEPRCDEILIQEYFNDTHLNTSWTWLNEPSKWSVGPNGLTIHPDGETDFWSRSYYEFIHDNGHFLFRNIPNNLNYTIYTKVKLYPLNKFDQAGLMARFNSDSWVKLAAEYGNEQISQLGSVVTNYFSDWSTRNIPSNQNQIEYRMAKIGNSWVLHAKIEGDDEWEALRVGYLENNDSYQDVPVGIFACSPTASGFRVEFEYIKICKFNSFIPNEVSCEENR